MRAKWTKLPSGVVAIS